MKKEQILDTAKNIVSNDRVKHYGTPKDNFTRIAKLWSVVLNRECTAAEVALCMAQVKVTRLMQTPDHTDSWVDMAGYAACGGEVTHKEDEEVLTHVTIRAEHQSPTYFDNSHWGMHRG